MICPGNSILLQTLRLAVVDWSRGRHLTQARPIRAFPSVFWTKNEEESKNLWWWKLQDVELENFDDHVSLSGKGSQSVERRAETSTRGREMWRRRGSWCSAAPELFLGLGCSQLLSFTWASCVITGPERNKFWDEIRSAMHRLEKMPERGKCGGRQRGLGERSDQNACLILWREERREGWAKQSWTVVPF